MKRITITMVSLIIIGCQQNEVPQAKRGNSGGVALVQSAEGKLYSVDCLRENASQIQSLGSAAMGTCMVDSQKLASATTAERGKFFASNYGLVYYPPTYLNPSYGNTSYPVGYNPYRDVSYYNNAFCSFLFGANSLNCFYLLGYQNPSYSQNYNQNCGTCLWYGNGSGNATQCLNSCFRGYHYY